MYAFGGGINESVDPVLVEADGTLTHDTYPQTRQFNGGFCVLEIPTRDAAVEWAARIATACLCAQEVREFQYDAES